MPDRDKVSIGGEIMPPSGCIIRALFDPGLFVNRGDNYGEPLHRWQARAVEAALALGGYAIVKVPTETDRLVAVLADKAMNDR